MAQCIDPGSTFVRSRASSLKFGIITVFPVRHHNRICRAFPCVIITVFASSLKFGIKKQRMVCCLSMQENGEGLTAVVCVDIILWGGKGLMTEGAAPRNRLSGWVGVISAV